MPKLRNLRIVNAQFNEGKNTYEDFRMPFHGYNATYELVNGGGKSVLLMLLMQCILPKSALTPDHPFKDMFAGGEKNRTTHVLAEWELEKSISDKKYLLTGFCAKRKAVQDDESRSDEIQSFNYIYNYNKSDNFDINSIPLCSYEGGEFVTTDYSKTLLMLRNKLPEYDIKITQRKREYQNWLKSYYILESEWNLIRGINNGENHLKPYFAKYKSSRTLVEGLLIKTIEECLKDREQINYEEGGDKSSAIAEALYKSQESLKKLQEEQDNLFYYDKLLSEVSSLDQANDRLISTFDIYGETKAKAAGQFNGYATAIQQNETEIRRIIEKIDRTESSHQSLIHAIEKINLIIFNVRVNIAKNQKNQYEKEIIPLENTIQKQKYDLNLSRAVNKYLLIKERELSILENDKILHNKKENRRDLYDKINPLGKTLYNQISIQINQETDRKNTDERLLREIQAKNESDIKTLGGEENQLGQNKKRIEQLNETISKLKQAHDELTQQNITYPQISNSLFVEDKIDAVTEYLAQLEQGKTELSTTIESLKEQISQETQEEKLLEYNIQHNIETINRLETEFTTFQEDKDRLQNILGTYGKENIELCLSYLKSEIQTFNEHLIVQKSKTSDLNRELTIIQKYGFSLHKDFVNSLEIMKERYPQSISGAEYLKELDENKRAEILELAPWLPKTILILDKYFKEIVRAPYTLPVEVQDASPILASIDLLRTEKHVTLGNVFIPHRDADFSKSVLTREKTIERIKKDLANAEENVTKIQLSIDDFSRDLRKIQYFSDRYPPNIESEKDAELRTYKDIQTEYKDKLRVNKEKRQTYLNDLSDYQMKYTEKLEKKTQFENNIIILQNLRLNESETRSFQQKHDDAVTEQKELDTSIRQFEQKILTSQLNLQKINESLRQTKKSLDDLQYEIRDYLPYAKIETEMLSGQDINEIRSEYRAAKTVIDEVDGNVGQIESAIASDRSSIEEYKNDIQILDISLDDLITENPNKQVSDDFIQQLQENIKEHEIQHNVVKSLLETAKENYQLLEHDFNQKIDQYKNLTSAEYSSNPNILDSKPFDDELNNRAKELSGIKEKIEFLKASRQSIEHGLKKLKDGFTEYRLLDASHNFQDSRCNAADQLIEPNKIEGELNRNHQDVERSKKQCADVKRTAIHNVTDIPIATEFKNVIKSQLKESDCLEEAKSNQKQLNDFSQIIQEKIELHQKTMEALKEVEANIVNQALGIAIIYRDYLKDFSQMSKLDIDGKIIEMVRINFEECIYPDDSAHIEMRRYIQDLNKGIKDGVIKRKDLQKSFRPEQLVGRVMDMGKIQVKIRKIEEGSQVFQKWDMIKASDGQENTMYIIFLIALMSYIRNIVVGRYDKNTSKILLLDNPFGSTAAYYLWLPIWSILKRNNIQLICSGHKISSRIREFFPIHHLLTEEIAKSERRRVNIKVEATGEAKEYFDRTQPKTILQWIETV